MLEDEFVLYGGTYLNKGGAAIAYGTLKTLREINISFQHIIDPEPFFPFDSLNLNAIYRFSDVLSIKPIDSINPISTFNPFIKCLLKSYSSEITQQKGSHIWHIGDSPFSDSRSALSVAGQVIALESLRRAVQSDVIIGGVSIGYPKTSLGRYLTKRYFCNYHFYVRGSYTFNTLLRLGVSKNNMVPICDFAFHLDKIKSDRVQQLANTLVESDKPIVGLCFRDFSYGGMQKKNIDCIHKLTRLLREKYVVYFIPTSYSYLKAENDYLFIKDTIQIDDKYIISIRDLSPGEIITLFSFFDAIVSSRLHGAVLGSLANVPTIHLYEGEKSLEVLGEVFGEIVPMRSILDFINGSGVEELAKLISRMIDMKEDLSLQLNDSIILAKTNSTERLKESITNFV